MKEKKFRKSLTVPKNSKGDTLWAFSNFRAPQNIRKFEEGPFGGKKIEKKVAHCRKNSKEDPIVPSGFVSYVKN